MNDAEIRSAVEGQITKGQRYAIMVDSEHYKTLKALATRYLELGGVVEEKEILPMTTDYRYGKVTQKCLHNYNLGRQDTLLAVSKRLEGVEETIKSVIKDGGGFPKVDDLSTAIRESILGKEGGE